MRNLRNSTIIGALAGVRQGLSISRVPNLAAAGGQPDKQVCKLPAINADHEKRARKIHQTASTAANPHAFSGLAYGTQRNLQTLVTPPLPSSKTSKPKLHAARDRPPTIVVHGFALSATAAPVFLGLNRAAPLPARSLLLAQLRFVSSTPRAASSEDKHAAKHAGGAVAATVHHDGTYLQRTWKHVKEEAQRYWLGLQLLGKQCRVCVGILQQVLHGEDLTRREHIQLRTTSADLLKMIPFAIIVVVPFMELALPIILWLFPSILPSTFEEEWKREEQMKRRLKARIEVARFLQDAVDQMAQDVKRKQEGGVGSADEFVIFMDNIHRGDARVTNQDIVRFSKLFTDDITLDSIGRMGLVNLCRLLELPVFGTDAILRFQLHQRIRSIRSDDATIRAEGVASLNLQELKEALHYRGMRATGMSKSTYRKELESWLDLHLDKKVPTSLLLMSRALKIIENVTEEDALKDALQALPEEAFKSAEVEAKQPDKVTKAKKKLESLQRQQEFIEKERKEKEMFLMAEFRAAAARFLETQGATLIREQLSDSIDWTQASVVSDDAATPLQSPSGDEAVTSQDEPVTSREHGLLMTLEAKWSEVEGELFTKLVAHLKEQQKWTKIDMLDAEHKEVLKKEIASRKDSLLHSLLPVSEATPTEESPTTATPTAEAMTTVTTQATTFEAAAQAAADTLDAELKEKASDARASEESKHAKQQETAEDVLQQPVLAAAGSAEATVAQSPATAAAKKVEKEELDFRVISEIASVLVLLGSKQSTKEEQQLVDHMKKASVDQSSELSALEMDNDIAKTRSAKAAKQLGGLVAGIIGRLEADIEAVGSKIGTKFHLIDADEDGVISEHEVRQAISVVLRRKAKLHEVEAVIDELDRNKDGVINFHEITLMASALSRKRHAYIRDEDGKTMEKPAVLTKDVDQLSDDEAVLWGCMLEEYRDRLHTQREVLEAEKRLDREMAASTVTSTHFPS